MSWEYCAPRVHHRRFPFNQNSRNFRNSANGTEISRTSFQKSWKRLNFRNANHSTEISGNFREQSWMEKNFLESFSKIWVYHARLSSFMEIFENAALFATGSSRKFNNRSFGWMENAPYFLSKLVVFLSFEICQFHLISHPDLTLFFLPWPRRSGYEIKFHFNQTLENKHRKLSWCK